MNKRNTKKNQWIVLGVTAAIFIVLIGAVLLMSKSGLFKKSSEGDTPENKIEQEVQSGDEAPDIEVEEGSLLVEMFSRRQLIIAPFTAGSRHTMRSYIRMMPGLSFQ